MIDRKQLKKGDTVLIVPNSDYTRDTTVRTARVETVGSKYIGVALVWGDGNVSQSVDKYCNEGNMPQKDYPSYRLFLGTEEEYAEYKEDEKAAKEIYHEIGRTLTRDLGLEKLKAIKEIIDTEDLGKTLRRLYFCGTEQE